MTNPHIAQIEAMLADDPEDNFLRYGLAMAHLSDGNQPAAVEKLRSMTDGTSYVPAFLQLGQILAREGDEEGAKATFRRGIELATQQGNGHAAGEMGGFLAALE